MMPLDHSVSNGSKCRGGRSPLAPAVCSPQLQVVLDLAEAFRLEASEVPAEVDFGALLLDHRSREVTEIGSDVLTGLSVEGQVDGLEGDALLVEDLLGHIALDALGL